MSPVVPLSGAYITRLGAIGRVGASVDEAAEVVKLVGAIDDKLDDGGRAIANTLDEAPNSAVRSGSGHGYAANVLEGGTGRAFAGHGELRYGSGDLIVPQGTSITTPRMGHQIQDVTGRLMEQGDWDALAVLARTNPKVADDLIGMATHLPGAKIPNFTLKAPDGLTIMRASKTVEDATPLQVLIKDAQGNWCWAACTKYRR